MAVNFVITEDSVFQNDFNATTQHERKHIDIALGTFSTGSYTAILNGIAYPFEVPPPLY